MISKRSQALLSALILSCLTACDNVSWGGADVAIVPPPNVSAAPATGASDPGDRMPEGPILYYVANRTDGAVMVPVGEIAGDSMLPLHGARDPRAFASRFIAEHMRQGAEFTLYRNGARVGTFVVQAAEPPAAGMCPALPRARGLLELTPGANEIPEFLAIGRTYAPEIRRRAATPLETSRTMQVLAPILAEKMLRARRAELPSNWQRAMRQLRPMPVEGGTDPGFATTFLVGDTLGMGADDVGYSLFYVGTPAQFSYDTVYVHFTNYAEGGKAAPRIVDFLDWNRDDQPELLLQVYGVRDLWFEVVGRGSDGTWRRTFRDRCQNAAAAPGLPEPTVQPGPGSDTARQRS